MASSIYMARPVPELVDKLVQSAHSRNHDTPCTTTRTGRETASGGNTESVLEVTCQYDAGEQQSRLQSDLLGLQQPSTSAEQTKPWVFGPVACLFRWYAKRNVAALPYQQCQLHLHHQPHAKPFERSLVPDMLRCPLPDPTLLALLQGERDKLNTGADPVLSQKEVMTMMEDFEVVPKLLKPQELRTVFRAALGLMPATQAASPSGAPPSPRSRRSPGRAPTHAGREEADATPPSTVRGGATAAGRLPKHAAHDALGPESERLAGGGQVAAPGPGRTCRPGSPTRCGLPHPEDMGFTEFCDMLVRIGAIIRGPGGAPPSPAAGLQLLRDWMGLSRSTAELRQRLAQMDDTAYERGLRRTTRRWEYVASQQAQSSDAQDPNTPRALGGWTAWSPGPAPRQLLDALLHMDLRSASPSKAAREWCDFSGEVISTGPVRVGQTRSYRILLRNRTTHSMVFAVDASNVPNLTACYSNVPLVPGKPAVVELTAHMDRVGEFQADITIVARPTMAAAACTAGQTVEDLQEYLVRVPFRVTCMEACSDMETNDECSSEGTMEEDTASR